MKLDRKFVKPLLIRFVFYSIFLFMGFAVRCWLGACEPGALTRNLVFAPLAGLILAAVATYFERYK